MANTLNCFFRILLLAEIIIILVSCAPSKSTEDPEYARKPAQMIRYEIKVRFVLGRNDTSYLAHVMSRDQDPACFDTRDTATWKVGTWQYFHFKQ